MLSRIARPLIIVLALAACSPIENTVDSSGYEPSYLEQTSQFGFEIGVPTDLSEDGWAVKDPSFLAGQGVDGFQRLTLRRVFGVQVDSPPGGIHLLNVSNEFGRHTRTTRMVIYVFEKPDGFNLEAVTDSVRGVAYDAFDEQIGAQPVKTIVYKGLNEEDYPRNASESLIPRHLIEGSRYYYFVYYWSNTTEFLSNTRRVLETFRLR